MLQWVFVHYFVILWQLCLIDFFYKTFAEYEAGFESKGKNENDDLNSPYTELLQVKEWLAWKISTSSLLEAIMVFKLTWETFQTTAMWLSMSSLR